MGFYLPLTDITFNSLVKLSTPDIELLTIPPFLPDRRTTDDNLCLHAFYVREKRPTKISFE